MSNELSIEMLCMVLPLQTKHLLVPSVNVAEIIDCTDITLVPNRNEWYLGTIDWRQKVIPLMDIDNFSDHNEAAKTFEKIAVMNVVTRQTNCGFFAIALQQTPHLIRVHPGELMLVEQPLGYAMSACVSWKTEHAFIPDLSVMEQAVLSQ